MTIENQFKSEIAKKYKSIRAFTQSIGIPYSTIDSMLKKGVSGTSVQTVIKVCNALDIDIESISTGTLVPKDTNADNLDSKAATGISEEAVIVAHAYDKASFKDKKLVCMQLELPPPKPKLVPYQSDMETALEH